MEHKLHHGDCLKAMHDIPSRSVDCVIADPPYGTTNCAWDSVIPLPTMWGHLKRIIKPRGAIVLFSAQPFTSALIMSNVEGFKYCWVWDKVSTPSFLLAKIKPMVRHEDICVFGDGAINYYPVMKPRAVARRIGGYRTQEVNERSTNPYPDDGKIRISTEEFPGSILTFSNADHNNRYHPTQKPIALLNYLVSTYSKEGDTVLDFTMGSGTTGVACERLQRNFIGIELDEGYYNVAKRRIEQATSQLHLFSMEGAGNGDDE